MEGIPPLTWDVASGTGLVGLVGVAIWLIFTGRLLPRSVYRELVDERNKWRDLAMSLDKQNQKLMVSAETATKVLEALPKPETRPDR